MGLFLLVGAEFVLRRTMGLGDPILYEMNPNYVYRPRPNQEVRRYYGTVLRVNNLGLRARGDWDAEQANKVLFLGDSVTYGGNHLGNEQLFSEIAVQGLDGYVSGNAGVLGWGVENIHGLIVKEGFLPAGTYVTTLIEDDFYRGLARADVRADVWYESPRYALREAGFILWCWTLIKLDLFDAVYRGVNSSGALSPEAFAEHAALKLKEMDEFLEARGFLHFVYLSPSRAQAMGLKEADPLILGLLERHGLQVALLQDRISPLMASRSERASWFQDEYHLTPVGHRIWGRWIHEDLRKGIDPADPVAPPTGRTPET